MVKADVAGSAEALATALGRIEASDGQGSVKVKVLLAAPGDVTKSDVALVIT